MTQFHVPVLREIQNGFVKLQFPKTEKDRQEEVAFAELSQLAIAASAVALTAIFAGVGTAILLSSLYAAYELMTLLGNWIQINQQQKGTDEDAKLQQLTQNTPILRAIAHIRLAQHLNKPLEKAQEQQKQTDSKDCSIL